MVKIRIHDLRRWTTDKRKTVDDKPFGGGAGMVLKVDIIDKALRALGSGHKILLTPQGKPFSQALAAKLARKKHLILVAGHYEGFDERIRNLVDEEISIGDYVLTGGELPAMVVVDAVSRKLKGVLGMIESLEEKRLGVGVPVYTRPEIFIHKGKRYSVPKVLLSGNHQDIEKWRVEHKKK